MFTHLQLQSGYSFFNSTITIEKLIQRAKSLDVGALALTDDGVLYGAVEFYQACKKNGIQPLLGLTITMTIKEDDGVQMPIVLLAKNNTGYQGLITLSTAYNTKSDWDINTIKSYEDDLICIIPSETPFIKEQLLEENYEFLKESLHPLFNIFKKGNLYIGAAWRSENDKATIDASVTFAEFNGIKTVALQDVRYLEEKDIVSYDCLQAMKYGEKWDGYTNRKGTNQRHFASRQEMEAKYSKWPELISNISTIVKDCHVDFDFNRHLLPEFPIPEEQTAQGYLRNICEQALPERYVDNQSNAITRLNDELSIIEQLGFSDYFLIVSDFVGFAKENGIATGPGRGSAAGSLVAYLLGITNVDPLRYGLLFERFLNPDRVTMPDIDIDFSDVRREEVISYVREKYGQTHVAQIITFGTFLARSLLRELMKTMDIDYRDQAYILKHLPRQSNEGLLAVIKQSESFRDYIKQSETLRRLFAVALTLEGLPRHMSTHAAGIVIGKQPLTEDVPLTMGSQDTYLTQYAMNELEAIGLLKIDILGLRNLSLMEKIVDTVKRQENIQLDPALFPEDDAITFELLQSGKTNGVFQLESNGMKRVLKNLKPSSLEDIIAVNALYRPGPMEQIGTYINRKQGKEKVTFLHKDLEPILTSTYGVLIYQEQIMQIAHQFAGLTLGEADILRRAISKKNRKLIEEQKSRFIAGCINKGYQLTIAEEVFSWIYRFADYGFNKSHSVAYSKIAFQLSYLKAHHPAAFFAGFLGTAMNDPSKFPAYVKEAKEMGIIVLPPSVNHSFAYFKVEKSNQIRIGFLAIKGIGYDAAKEIVTKRKQGSFSDVFDFCLRVKMKRNIVETLILAGGFDETYGNRASLLASLDQAYARAELFGDMNEKGDLFSGEMKMAPFYTEMEDFSLMQKLSDEKELLQLYVSDHPLQAYRNKLSMLQYMSLNEAKQASQHSKITVIIISEQVKKIHTKRGESMAFITISDETSEMEAVIFPALYREVNPNLKTDAIFQLEGKISIRDKEKQIIVDQLFMVDLEEVVANIQPVLYVRVTKEKAQQEVLPFLKQIASNHPGKTEIILYNEVEEKSFRLSQTYHLNNTNEVKQDLDDYFGSENVVFRK